MTKKRPTGAGGKLAQNDLSKVQEEDFTYAKLNDIFFTHVGAFRGAKTLLIGGIEVTKTVSVYKSNSGKSQDSDVEITWVGSDGTRHTVTNGGSRYAGSRRNDPGRSWGLPE